MKNRFVPFRSFVESFADLGWWWKEGYYAVKNTKLQQSDDQDLLTQQKEMNAAAFSDIETSETAA